MGLVHRQQGNLHLLGKAEEIRRLQPLRRGVDQLVGPPPRPAEDLPVLFRRQRGVDKGGGDARLGQDAT